MIVKAVAVLAAVVWKPYNRRLTEPFFSCDVLAVVAEQIESEQQTAALQTAALQNAAHQTDEACATYLKAVADPTRLRIIRALQVGPLSVSDIAEVLQHEIGCVSHHLRVLYHADIVQTRREGKYVYYSFREQILRPDPDHSDSVLDFGCCRLDVGEHGAA